MEFIQDIRERSDQQGTEREVPFLFLVRQRSKEPAPALKWCRHSFLGPRLWKRDWVRVGKGEDLRSGGTHVTVLTEWGTSKSHLRRLGGGGS